MNPAIRNFSTDEARASLYAPAGFFMPRRARMPNHLTPEELSKELGIERDDVIRLCVEEGVPIYQGKIDKILFQAQLKAISRAQGATQALR